MGLASKIKNSSGAAPQSSQPPTPSYGGGYAPAYDYPPPQDYDRYGSVNRANPQHVADQHGAPSAPPVTKLDPQQYYSAGYAAPYQQSRVESNTTAPSLYGGQPQTSPSARQGHSLPYSEQANPSLYAGQTKTPPSAGQGHNFPYSEQMQTPTSIYAGGQPSYVQPAQYQQASHQHLPLASSLAVNRDMLAQKLQAIIQANGLQAFYDQGRFQVTLQKVSSVNFAEIAAHWRIDRELAYDLAPLALYDIVFYCDDSGSMMFEENGERIDDLKFILSKVSGIATMFDDDGVTVRFMNSEVNGDGIRNVTDVANLISKVKFSGMTPLGTNLDRKVIQPCVLRQAMSNMAKPVLAIVITDGEPSGEDRGTIRRVIQRAKEALTRTRYGGGALAVQIAQVGKDAKTQKFLESLDKDPVIGGMIDCTSYYELEEEEFARKGVTLSPELWLLKMCVGAIDLEYDEKDD